MRRLLPILLVALVTCLAFWKPLFQHEFTLLSGGDMCSQSYPWFNAAAHWLKRGSLLLWDPYVYSGKANLGELQPGILYPLNWVVMSLPAGGRGLLTWMQGLIIVNYLLAAYFAYLLARSFDLTPWGSALAGMVFALGGYTVQIYGFLNIFSGFIWMPLVVLLFRKALLEERWKARIRWILWSGGGIGLSFLAGHHVPPIHIGLFLLFYSVSVLIQIWHRSNPVKKLATAVSLASVAASAALLTALQWLPSMEWAQRALRWVSGAEPIRWGEKIPYSALEKTGNIDPQAFFSLLLPHLGGHASLYVGSGVLLLVSIGLLFEKRNEARFFSVAAFLYLLLSWGGFSVMHGWANTFIPGVWFAREVFHYLIPFQLCLAMLAGFGLDYLVRNYLATPDVALRVFVRRAAWGMASFMLSAGVLILAALFLKGYSVDHPHIRALVVLMVYLSILGILLFLVHTGRLSPPGFRFLILALVLVDLASHFSLDIRTRDRTRAQENPSVEAYWRKTPAAEFLISRRQHEYFRVDDPDGIFPPNFGDAWRLESTFGHGATALVNYLDFRAMGWGPATNASALLNARYFLCRTEAPGMRRVFANGDAVYENPRAVPRVFAVARYRLFESDKEMLDWISTPLFAPRQTVLLNRDSLKQLPSEFLGSLVDERDRLRVQVLSYLRAAERGADRLQDEEARRRVYVWHAPWGWSPGDEFAMDVRPDDPTPRGYLILNYIPTDSQSSRLMIQREDSSTRVGIPVQLPGLQTGEAEPKSPRQAVVDLGQLARDGTRISFSRTEECSAHIDSVGIARSAPPPETTEVGEVRITSFQPNRLKLTADLKRPAFVVASEVIYPGWEALVDGRPAPLLTGDYILRAVPVPAGMHEIVLRFRSKTFQTGLLVSLLSLGAMISVLVIFRSRCSLCSRIDG